MRYHRLPHMGIKKTKSRVKAKGKGKLVGVRSRCKP